MISSTDGVGPGLQKAVFRHANLDTSAGYDGTNQLGKDRACAALMGVKPPIVQETIPQKQGMC